MQVESNQAQHALRQSVGERPFAVIKHVLRVRELLLCGTDRVRAEWRWITNSVKLMILTNLVRKSALSVTAMSSGDHGPPNPAGA